MRSFIECKPQQSCLLPLSQQFLQARRLLHLEADTPELAGEWDVDKETIDGV